MTTEARFGSVVRGERREVLRRPRGRVRGIRPLGDHFAVAAAAVVGDRQLLLVEREQEVVGERHVQAARGEKSDRDDERAGE